MTRDGELIRGLGQVLIGGAGRSGTTLLVQLLTHLGFDTGYSRGEAIAEVDPISKAGLERNLSDEHLPYIIKSPWFAEQVTAALAQGLQVEAAIIPLRNLYEAAESRRQVYREAERRGLNPLAQPGSLWKVTVPSHQEQALATQLYRFLEPLVVRGIPIYWLDFPRFTADPGYLFAQLEPFFSRHGISRECVAEVHRAIVRKEWVTHFRRTTEAAATPVTTALSAASSYRVSPDCLRNYSDLIAPLFSSPARFVPSPWTDHVPFLFVLFRLLRPRTYVEFGVHRGCSLIAAATAARDGHLPTRLYGLDTWHCDGQAGQVAGNSVDTKLAAFLARELPAARLLRGSYAEARARFPDASVDLLHINGPSTYEGVSEAFHSWLPAMSEQGVILFHNITMTDRDCAVHRLWAELKQEHTTLEFHHGQGLGVLFLNDALPSMAPLLELARDDAATEWYRSLVADMGTSLRERSQLALRTTRFEGLLAATSSGMMSSVRRVRQALDRARRSRRGPTQ